MNSFFALLLRICVAALLVATVSCNSEYEEWGQREADSAFVVSGYNEDIEELQFLLREFAKHHEMQFFDETIMHPEHGALVNIEIGDPSSVMVWATTGIINPRLKVLVFAGRSNPTGWKPYEADLKQRLSNRFGALKDITTEPPD